MKLRKYLTTFAILIMSMFALCGCANIEFIRAVDSQNVIVDRLEIEVDESKINKSGVDLSTVMSAIENDITIFRLSVEKWKQQFINYPEIVEAMKDGIYIYATPPIGNEISISIEFSSWQMFGLFYGYTEIEEFEYSKAMEDVGPFIDKIINEEHENENYGLFLIKYSILRNNGIIDDIPNFEFNNTNYYDKYVSMTNNHYSLEDVDITQSFYYPDDRVHSNADNVQVEHGMTFLTWKLNNKLEGFEMEMYWLYPRAMWWYISALVISAIVVIVLIIVIYRKSKGKVQEKITRWDVEKDGK